MKEKLIKYDAKFQNTENTIENLKKDLQIQSVKNKSLKTEFSNLREISQ
jgi:hypothetical protein